MCDIYMHKCKQCDAMIDMHLADFDTGPDEIEVFCEKHIPQDLSEGVLWEYDDDREEFKGSKKVFIQCKTRNAQANWDGNHPNFCDTKPLKIFGRQPLPDTPSTMVGGLMEYDETGKMKPVTLKKEDE